MAIAINGTGTITGISVGGLNDSIITSSELANAAVTAAKLDQAAWWEDFAGGSINHDAIYRAYPNAVAIDDGAGAFDANGNQIDSRSIPGRCSCC
jgi:hypothetical protein